MYWIGLLLLGIVSAKHEAYDGHSLYRVIVQDVEQAAIFNMLTDQLNLDVWVHSIPGRDGVVLVPKNVQYLFQSELHSAGIKYGIEVQNIKEMLDMEDRLMKETPHKKSNKTGLLFDRIYTYSEVNNYLEDLATSYPGVVSLVTAGQSFEGRDIKYVKISSTKFQDSNKPIIFIQSLLHAREWITLPVTLYAIHKLVIDVTDQDMAQDVDWIILPIANPDGYEYSHKKFRFWRKNRSTGSMIGDVCVGVDLNRNYDINWSLTSSKIPCAETFHGRSPFSEPETAVTRDIISEHGNRIQLFLDIHSFGSMILFGYGTGELPVNAETLNLVGDKMAEAIDDVKMSWNQNYTVGNVALVLYKASGSAQDYALAVGVPLSYTFELPGYRYGFGTGLGFLVDPKFIEQAGMETWEGIRIGTRFVLNNIKMRRIGYPSMFFNTL